MRWAAGGPTPAPHPLNPDSDDTRGWLRSTGALIAKLHAADRVASSRRKDRKRDRPAYTPEVLLGPPATARRRPFQDPLHREVGDGVEVVLLCRAAGAAVRPVAEPLEKEL